MDTLSFEVLTFIYGTKKPFFFTFCPGQQIRSQLELMTLREALQRKPERATLPLSSGYDRLQQVASLPARGALSKIYATDDEVTKSHGPHIVVVSGSGVRLRYVNGQ